MTRKSALVIIIIVILAAALRTWGIGWGLPASGGNFFSYHPDETMVLISAMRVNFFAGQLDTGFYNYGSLFIFLVNFAVLLATGWGLINLSSGDITSAVNEFAKSYMAGRVVAVLLGIATVYLVYALGKRAYGRRVGLLAALFTAVMPIHVMHSKFMTVDVPATFFVVLALIFAVRISDGQRLRDYLLAGLFAGLAAGTKYNAGLVILSPIVAHLATDKAKPFLRMISPKLLSIVIAAAAGFLIGTPGVLLAYDKFSRDFHFEVVHTRTGHGLVFVNTACGYIHHITDSLWPGMGLPLLVLAVIGLIYAVRRRTTGDLVLLIFFIAYYGLIGAAQVKFARYTIPLLPILAILAARVSMELVGRLRSGLAFARFVGHVVVLTLILATTYTLAYSLSIDRMFASTDTRDRAAAWIRDNIPIGMSIGLPTIPWFYTPPLDPYFGFFSADFRYERMQEFIDYPLVVSKDREWDSAFLERESPDYVVLSEFEYFDRLRIKDSAAKKYFRALRRDYRLERRFADEPSLFGWRIPILRKLPHDMSYASPTILLYSRKAD